MKLHEDTPPTRKEDVKDPVGLIGWPKDKGRDGERTPMQWSDAANAGFTSTSVTPWLQFHDVCDGQREDGRDRSELIAGVVRKADPDEEDESGACAGDNVMLDNTNTKC